MGALIAGCGSTLPASQQGTTAANSADAQTFSGTLTTKPAIRNIHLTPGEALRWWVRPTDGKGNGLSLAIATTLRAPATGGLPSGADFSDYSDPTSFDQFFSESSDGGSLDIGGLEQYGIPIVTTGNEYEVEYTANVRVNPLFFSDFARTDSRSGPDNGAWIAFIAPQEGNYTLLIGGFGGFTSGYSTQKPPGPIPHNAPFDANQPTAVFTGPQWLVLCQSQLAFLYDPAGYPGGPFVKESGDPGDEDYEKVDVSPDTHLAPIKAGLTDYADYLAHPDE